MDDDDEHGPNDLEYARAKNAALEEHETTRTQDFEEFADAILRNAMARNGSSSKDGERDKFALPTLRVPMEGDLPIYAIRTKVRRMLTSQSTVLLNWF